MYHAHRRDFIANPVGASPRLVLAHQPRVGRNVGGEDGGEAALDGHGSAFPACLTEAVEEPIDYSLFEVRT